MSPEHYNRTLGPGLTVLVMDTVRKLHTTQEVTLPLVVRTIGAQLEVKANLHSRLYSNVRRTVRALAHAGLVQTERREGKQGSIIAFITIIKPTAPCSE